jgi:hypothetical protein
VRVETAVFHSCPQPPELEAGSGAKAGRVDPGVALWAQLGGEVGMFVTASDRAGSTSLWVLARRLSPHTGQPVPPAVRVETVVFHSRPQLAHCHQSLRLDRAPSRVGSIPGLRCGAAQRRGRDV